MSSNLAAGKLILLILSILQKAHQQRSHFLCRLVVATIVINMYFSAVAKLFEISSILNLKMALI